MSADDRVPIPGTHRGVWPGSREVQSLSSETDVRLTAWLRPPRGAELDVAYAQTLGATLPQQRKYLEPTSLAERTAADPADVESLSRYCERFGLTIVESHWRSVVISGPIQRLIRAFGATVAMFVDTNQRRFRHRSGALHVPADLAAKLRGVFGLHQWPRSQKLGALERHATPLSASEVAARYRFPNGDGSGQTIGVLQFRGIFKPADFDLSMRTEGVATDRPIVKRVDDAAVAHEIETTKDLEAALDVQVIGALAPGARIVVYEAPDDERGFLDAIRAALFDEEYRPSILSISYGWPEHLWTPAALDILSELFTVAALFGVSIFCSSGDNGAELDDDGKPHVLAPASSPFAHACGATVIRTTRSGEEEVAWERSGGGFSARFDPPSWQSIARSEATRYGIDAGRGVPDVAAEEQPGYRVFMDGIELAMGGTSAVAPMWAALTARINQRLGLPIGFFAPLLYARASGGLFRDVTTGSNGRFQARAGWNPCTGLGVPVGVEIEKALREGA